MRYHPFRHLGLKALSLALALLLWATVSREPIVERTLRVPLQFQNVPENLLIIGNPLGMVDVRVRGGSGSVSRLEPGGIVAVVDLSTARPGSRLFHLMPEQVRAPVGLEVDQVAPSTIGIEFERRSTKVVPVRPATEGDPAPGYIVGEITSDPARVELVGPHSHILRITEATTEPVPVDGATSTVRDQVTIGVADSEIRLKEVRAASVTVNIAPAPAERTLTGVPVRLRNLPARLTAQVEPPIVDLVARGTREALDRPSPDAFTAFVDLAGLGPGRYNLPVRVETAPPVGISSISPPIVLVRIK